MSKPMVVFGLRDLPRPRGAGFLYCKLAPHYREKSLIELDLYAEPAELREIYEKGIRVFFALYPLSNEEKVNLITSYDTENMQPHAQQLLAEALKGQ